VAQLPEVFHFYTSDLKQKGKKEKGKFASDIYLFSTSIWNCGLSPAFICTFWSWT